MTDTTDQPIHEINEEQVTGLTVNGTAYSVVPGSLSSAQWYVCNEVDNEALIRYGYRFIDPTTKDHCFIVASPTEITAVKTLGYETVEFVSVVSG